MRLIAAAALCAVLGVATGAAAGPRKVPRLDHVVVVVFENKEADEIVGNAQAPTFNRLARRYASLTHYSGVTHPSLPNYLALVSGSTHGLRSDCTDCTVGGSSLADALDRAGKTWKVYAEGLPRQGYTGVSAGRYARKHVPFLYFRHVLADRRRIAKVVPLLQLGRDLARGRLPSYSFVVPDLCHDMHDCPVAVGDAWLKRFVGPLLAGDRLRNGVLFVLFDEGRTYAGGGGRVAALGLGPRVRPGARDATPFRHYSLLRTVEDALGLERLGRSAAARPITGIWKGTAARP